MLGAIALKVAGFLAGGSLTRVVDSFSQIYKAKLDAGETHEKLAADLATRQVELDARDAELQARLTASPDQSWVRILFALPPGIYYAKMFIWDKTLGLGVTDPLDDRMFWVAQTAIIAFLGGRIIRDTINAIKR